MLFTVSLEDVSIESTVLLSEAIQPHLVESSPTAANTGAESTRQVRVKIKFFISSPFHQVSIAPFYVQKPCQVFREQAISQPTVKTEKPII